MKGGELQKVRWIVAITGASGSIYARRFLYLLARNFSGESALIISEAALRVYRSEENPAVTDEKSLLEDALSSLPAVHRMHSFQIYNEQDIGAAPASGSAGFSGMVVIPCSMKTLGQMASGIASDLIARAADVMLKERRPLVLVPRETPYNLIHLRNMTTLTESGAILLPASPGFYRKPESLEDLGDFIALRAFRLLGGRTGLEPEWVGDNLDS